MGPWTNISKPFSVSFTEGPSILKMDDQWLIYFDSYQKKIYEAVQTKDFKSFENITTNVQVPAGHKHGTILPVKRKWVNQLIKKLKR